jgi:copper transport protein
MFQVVVWPGRVGSDDFVLRLMAGDGSLLRAKEAILALSLPERGIEPLERKAVLGRGRLVTDFEKIMLDDFGVPAL